MSRKFSLQGGARALSRPRPLLHRRRALINPPVQGQSARYRSQYQPVLGYVACVLYSCVQLAVDSSVWVLEITPYGY